MPRALTAVGLRFPKSIVVFWLVVAFLAAIAVTKLRIETSMDSVLDRSDPAWVFYQESQDRFGGDEIISILIEAGEPFDRATLNEVVRLTKVFQNLPGVWRVDSLATVPLIRFTTGGDLSLDGALSAGVPESQKALEKLSNQIQSDRIAPKTVISGDGKYFAINLVLESGVEDQYLTILEVVNDQLAGQRAWVSGVPIFRVETDLWTRKELVTFIPATLVVVGLLCLLLLLDLRLAVIPLLSSGIGSLVVLGVMALTETPLTISTVILPSILLALGCAYAMHFLTAVSPEDRGIAFAETMMRISDPVTLSGLTTTLGFLAIGFVRIKVIQDMAAFGALGVLIVLGITLTFIPAALKLFPGASGDTALRRFVSESLAPSAISFVLKRRRVVIMVWLVSMAIIGIGIFKLRVETDVILWFPRDHKIRVDYDVIRNRLSGISPMNIVIDSPVLGSVTSPDVLLALEGLTAFVDSLDEVGRAISITDPLTQLDGILSDQSNGMVPTRGDRIEQYLLILESNEYMQDLVTGDRKSANVLLRVDENSSDVLLKVGEKAEEWWSRNGVSGYDARTTGVMHEFARSEEAIALGQIRGLIFVLLTVGGILVAAFRRIRIVAATLAANVIPIVMVFGGMGLSGIRLDAGTVVVGCIAFGIAVDDTIHTVTEFSRKVESSGSLREAVFRAYSRVLPAVIFTTIIVSAGFLVLGFSNFLLIRNLGLVTSGVMVLCLVAVVMLLPALLSIQRETPR